MSYDKQIISGLHAILGKMEIALGEMQEAILWTNKDGTILWSNKAFDDLLECPHISLPGINVFEVFPLEREDGTPVSFDEHPCLQPPGNFSLSGEIYVFRRKYKTISLEISASSTEMVSGSRVVTIRNLSALQLHREKLEKAKDMLEVKVKQHTDEILSISNRYKNILLEAVDAIVTIDHRGLICTFNPAAETLFGYAESEVLGKSVTILMPSPYREKHDGYVQQYLKSGKKKVIGTGREVVGVRRNGELLTLDLALSEIRSKNHLFFTGIIRDISATKEMVVALEKAKFEAEQANRVKSDFLARMSHEIRTPMTAILGMAELLKETKLDSEQEQFIDIFKAAGKHLLTIINDLLDLEKIEAEQFSLESVVFDLHGLFKETYNIMVSLAEKKGLKLEYKVAPEIPAEIVGDPVRLKQVLLNIIGNAIKFTEDGMVSFYVSPGETAASDNDLSTRIELKFEVRDTGVGIQEDEQEKIFENFSQVDHSITRKFGGTGLGLAISKKLVRQMGGEIAVSSKLNEGSVFSFNAWFLKQDGRWIMTQDGASEYVGADENNQEAGPACETLSSSVSILLVDDSPDNCFLFKAFLKHLECGLDVAENGRIAFEKFKVSNYDLVLMDIQMPVLDGYSATELIRAHEIWNNLPHTPIVALTANAREEEKVKSLRAGCDMHLNKPVSKKDLLAAICSLLGGSARNQTGDDNRVPATVAVQVDRMLEELIPGFMENRRNDITALQDAISKDDMERVSRIGHTLKGSGGGYGFNQITEIGQALERAASEDNRETALHLVSELASYLDHVEVIFVD